LCVSRRIHRGILFGVVQCDIRGAHHGDRIVLRAERKSPVVRVQRTIYMYTIVTISDVTNRAEIVIGNNRAEEFFVMTRKKF